MKLYFVRHGEKEKDFFYKKDASTYAQQVANETGEEVPVLILRIDSKDLRKLITQSDLWGIPSEAGFSVLPHKAV